MQALVRREASGFSLRHVEDRAAQEADLRLLPVAQLRDLAHTSHAGAFRPLRSAPSLRNGWRAFAASAEELGAALDLLYPGALADWRAVRQGLARATSFRDFTARQTGMYRITAKLSDSQAGVVIAACCNPPGCLKQRLWSAPGLSPDTPEQKSVIPCLEPCPLFLEFARKAMRIEQEETAALALSASDVETLLAALASAAAHPALGLREADFAAPLNPRRIWLALEKLRRAERPLLPKNAEAE